MTAAKILLEAAELVGKTRAEEHGDFHELGNLIAHLWEIHLKQVHNVPVVLTAWDVAMMLKNIKDARALVNPENMDNYRDGSGYFGLAAKEIDDA